MDRSTADEKVVKDVRDSDAWDTFKMLPNRFVSLIYNMISRWGLILALTVFLIVGEHLQDKNTLIAYIVFTILFLFKSDGFDFIKDIVGKVK